MPQGLTQGNAGKRHPYDFSFSGVKTAVARWIEQRQAAGEAVPVDDVCASLAASVADVLATKAMRGCEQYGSDTLIVGGGFSANSQLRAALLEQGERHGVDVRLPERALCTDNGAMIAVAGLARLQAMTAQERAAAVGRIRYCAKPRWSLAQAAHPDEVDPRQAHRNH